ncbi:methyltransferase domain-containing protein [Myxococcota bacterium]|nr:methyltransferase domain-containing protein [Myxococcota bacterium]
MSTALNDLDDVRARIRALSATLDPHSRYIRELLELVDAARDVAGLEHTLSSSSRGARHSGPDVFARMTLDEKLLANLITPETSLFRFSEGELEALDRELLPQLRGRTAKVLIVPCSHGEEAFTIAAYFAKQRIDHQIVAFDVQPALIEEARTGRLTFGYPTEYLAQPGFVSSEVLARIDFRVGDAFALPLPPAERELDVVLCRNFVGYFQVDRACALVDALAARVAPGGVLFLDGFCVQKMPELVDVLARRGASAPRSRAAFVFPRTDGPR